MKEHWGNIVWRFIHVLVEKVDEKKFKERKNIIIDFINYIGTNLPCGFCSQHYKKFNFICYDKIYHKDGLIKELWIIHNRVNTSKKSSEYNIRVLNQYNVYDLNEVKSDIFELINMYKHVDIEKIQNYLQLLDL